jgi:hypothetical protein
MGSMVACRFESNDSVSHSDRDKRELTESDDDDRTDSKDDDKDNADQEMDDNDENDLDDLKSLIDRSLFKDSRKPVSVDDLKEVFPMHLNGLIRSNLSGDHAGAFGFKINTVKALYKKDDHEIKFEVIDFGGLTSILSELADWSDSDLSHEDEDGYSKVDIWHGYKSFEKSDTKHHEASLAFIYKDRLIINVQGDQQSLNDLKYITEQNILSKLDRLDLTDKNDDDARN